MLLIRDGTTDERLFVFMPSYMCPNQTLDIECNTCNGIKVLMKLFSDAAGSVCGFDSARVFIQFSV